LSEFFVVLESSSGVPDIAGATLPLIMANAVPKKTRAGGTRRVVGDLAANFIKFDVLGTAPA
jgi:hypothetical protein